MTLEQKAYRTKAMWPAFKDRRNLVKRTGQAIAITITTTSTALSFSSIRRDLAGHHHHRTEHTAFVVASP